MTKMFGASTDQRGATLFQPLVSLGFGGVDFTGSSIKDQNILNKRPCMSTEDVCSIGLSVVSCFQPCFYIRQTLRAVASPFMHLTDHAHAVSLEMTQVWISNDVPHPQLLFAPGMPVTLN